MTPHDQLINTVEEIDRLHIEIKPLKQECNELQSRIKELGMSRHNHDREHFENASNELSEKAENLSKLENNVSENKKKITLKTLLIHQEKIEATQAELDNYQQLISEQQNIIDVASNKEDLTSVIITQREELLTEIALGNNKANELKKIDEQLETINANQCLKLASNQKIIDQANQTINGLNRRINTVQEQLGYLQSLSPKMLDILLMVQAAQIASEFNDIAIELMEKLKLLVAINELIPQLGQRTRDGIGLFNLVWQLVIPVVNSDKPPIQANNAWFTANAQDGIDKLKSNLCKQGIKLEQAGL